MPKKITTEEFVRRAKIMHGEKYDYTKAIYVDCLTKVCIICPIHGEFWQPPVDHLQGAGCKHCACVNNGQKTVLTTEDFIRKARLVHGDKYDYSKTRYVNAHTKVCIICPIHGEFWQEAHSHLKGHGCKLCSDPNAGDRTRFSHKDFLFHAKRKHGNKYEYPMKYINSQTRITITCPIHGNFTQLAYLHLRGSGCPVCGAQRTGDAHFLGAEHHINEAKNVHGNKYNYSFVPQDAKSTDIVPIICDKHGVFYQALQYHKRGNGCPYCQKSHGEERIEKFLKLHNIEFSRQHKVFNENLFCKNKKFFVDFFLTKYNIVIEFNGAQHYRPVDLFGGQKTFIQQQSRDVSLRLYCNEHKIKLIEIPYTEYDNIETILKKNLNLSDVP